MKLWYMASRDGYSLPVVTADSAAELARLTGASESTIRSIAHRNATGKFKDGKFWCVECGEDETDEEVRNAINSAVQRRKARVCADSFK